MNKGNLINFTGDKYSISTKVPSPLFKGYKTFFIEDHFLHCNYISSFLFS